MNFKRKRMNNLVIFESDEIDNISLIYINGNYRFRIKDENEEWIYPMWNENVFHSPDDAFDWLDIHDLKSVSEDNIDYDDSVFSSIILIPSSERHSVFATTSSRDLKNLLSRVRSSNVWAYGINPHSAHSEMGDVIVQFKNKNGGAGDIYIYYDVPKTVYNRWQSAPSKGHYFWNYIRDNFRYSKLTGDKKGKLKNAVNNYKEPEIQTTASCQFMVEFVNDYLNGKMGRETFEKELPEYFEMNKNEMYEENEEFTNKFIQKIIYVVRRNKNSSDENFKKVIKLNINQLSDLL